MEIEVSSAIVTNSNKSAQLNTFSDFNSYSTSIDQHLQSNDNVEHLVLQYFTDNRNDYTSLNAYPIIKKIFLKYNTPLSSSAPVECLFSFATIINSPKVNGLTNEMFEQKVVLKANLLNKPEL